MPVRVRVLVSGRVQGVFFRARTRDEARRLGLTGWVCNRRDGRVEAEVQGDRQEVDEMLAFFSQGPPHAQVTDVEVVDLDVVDGEEGFRIL